MKLYSEEQVRELLKQQSICNECGGTGVSIYYVIGCCGNANEDGSCCNRPIPEPAQRECSNCCATGLTPIPLPEPAMEVENKNVRKVKTCNAVINGTIDGLELDNTCDVVEKSIVISLLYDLKRVLENEP